MKKIEEISSGMNYSAASTGKYDELGDYVYTLAPGIEIPGKVFIGEPLKCSGTEVSFQIVPPSAGGDFLHTHTENEELYVVIKGSGEFQVDGSVFPIAEGGLVRVAPAGKRAWRNTGMEPIVMMVIQSKDGSLTKKGISDGHILEEAVEW